MPASPRSQHAQSDMDLDTASSASPAPEDLTSAGPAGFSIPLHAENASMQPHAAGLPAKPSQPLHQEQQQWQLQQRSHGLDSSTGSHAAMHHAGSSYAHGAEEVVPSQQAPSTSQSLSQPHGTTHGTTHVPGSPGILRQDTAGHSSRHGLDEEEEQKAVALQHASSTSAMMSLAKQASQPSWASHQQQVKKHGRHIGQSPL